MSNFYSQTKGQDTRRPLFRPVQEKTLIDTAGNLPPLATIHPGQPAPIIRRGAGRRWLTAGTAEALQMRRPLPDEALTITAEQTCANPR
ncbi:hypothetical protein [Gemmobacter sp.]|uniref:hypothetical protein n=1 Tax=Gemmobacter sp. TaxID=1898957 RepID=UPI002AFF8230|nr:hypothetical protein [Gemmobacter sp.]